MSVTVTLHLWWLLAYLAIGGLLFLPLNWIANRQVSPAVRFGESLMREGPLRLARGFVVQVVAWPLAVWEVVR